MLSTILFSIVTPDCGLIQAQQCGTILLTTLNNVGSTTLFKAVLINPEQVVRFLPCIQGPYHHAGYKLYIYYVYYNNIFVSNNILKQFLSNMTIYDLSNMTIYDRVFCC